MLDRIAVSFGSGVLNPATRRRSGIDGIVSFLDSIRSGSPVRG
jgi:hypothetical protein